MKKISLNVRTRSLIGKKARKLRLQNILPGNVYGKEIPSLAVEVDLPLFQKTYKEAGETHVLDFVIDKQEPRPILIHQVQIHPVSGKMLHVDFYQVDLKEKIKAKVPVEIAGVAGAVSQKLGVLLTLLDEIEVEALPTDLPEKITLDVTKLAQVGDAIKVKDIPAFGGVTIMTDSEAEIVKVGHLVTKEAVALEAEEAAAQAAQTTSETPAEGIAEAPAKDAVDAKSKPTEAQPPAAEAVKPKK